MKIIQLSKSISLINLSNNNNKKSNKNKRIQVYSVNKIINKNNKQIILYTITHYNKNNNNIINLNKLNKNLLKNLYLLPQKITNNNNNNKRINRGRIIFHLAWVIN